jgi:basic membrane protein A
MFKKLSVILAVIMIASLVLVACAPAATPVVEKKIKVCQVTDTGGIDDKTFNATAWKGAENAKKDFGVEIKFLESQQQTDYEKNINAFIEDKCDLIVTVGFLLGDATQKAAVANVSQKIAIVDYSYDPVLPNVLGLVFSVDQPSFMAGYLAAGMSKTGKVGTYGGIQIPPLEPFMTGFYNGVMYYNTKKGTAVQVLGWDPATKTGLFTGNFESTDDGKRMGETLMDEGADIIFPVAGPCGLGTAAAIVERGNAMMIGVDTDMTISSPEYKPILLTSVLKNMDKAVYDSTKSVVDGKFAGGLYVGTLVNGGVGLAPYYDFDSKVSAELKAEIEQIKADIIAGTLKTQ